MNGKVVLFPVDRTSIAIVRNASSFQLGEVIPLLPQSLKTLANKDISEMDGGYKANIRFSIDYEQSIEICKKVYFINSTSIKEDEVYIQLIEYAKCLNKEIVISKCLAKRLGIESDLKDEELKTYYSQEEIIDIEIPIISIFTYGQYCNQVDIELSMKNYFLKHDYKVTLIGDAEASDVFDFAPIPQFLFDNDISVEEKIIRFNRYVYNVSKHDHADVIIIGVSNSIMKYNNQILNGLGIIPFIMQSSVQSDVAVLSIYQNNYPKRYFDEVQQFIKYRLGVLPEYFCIANTKIMQDVDDRTVVDYLYLSTDYVLNNIDSSVRDGEYNIFNALDPEGRERVYALIEKELLTNICIM